MVDGDVVRETETWLIERGTPHLMTDYTATDDVFTRAVPVLSAIFLLSMFGASNLDWPWWLNVGAVVAGLGVLLAVWAIANRIRQRPATAPPDSVGPFELTAFVGGPTLLQLLSGQPRAAMGTAATLVGLLALVYVVTSYALVPLVRWAVRATFREVQAVVGLLVRGLPLLLLVVTFLFINAELWDVAANVPGPFFAVVVGVFASTGLGFLAVRLPAEFVQLGDFADADDLRQVLDGSPMADASDDALAAALATPLHLSRRQRLNLALVAVVSQGLQVVLLGALMGGFLVLLGVFAVGSITIERWTGRSGDVLLSTTLWGNDLLLHAELLRTAGFLGAFSALHFTVTSITDETYRREFLEGILADVRQTLGVARVYWAVASTGASSTRRQ